MGNTESSSSQFPSQNILGPSEPGGVADTWARPKPGKLKVNFDGSVRRDGNGSAGFVIRDASARVILAGNIVFAPSSAHEIQEAELRGAWEGMQAAVERLQGTRRLSIWLEGDSRTVIDWINGVYRAPPYFDSRLQDIRRWRDTNLDSFEATHVSRKANKPADWLAANADSTSLKIWSRDDFPDLLRSYLSADASSPPQFPSRDGDGEEEAPSSSMGTAAKVGAALAGTALLALGAWSLASSSGTDHPLSEPQGGGYRHQPPRDAMPYSSQPEGGAHTLEAAGVVTWAPPQRGQLKVNFDGSVRGDGSGGAGFVIRDASARAILAGSIVFPLRSPQEIQEAELRGAWEGLQAAAERSTGIQKPSIWLEGDSKTVVEWINGDYEAPRHFDSYLRDIREWRVNKLDSFKATHVPRNGNKPANWLAGNAATTSLQIWSPDDFPDRLRSLLSADADGCASARAW